MNSTPLPRWLAPAILLAALLSCLSLFYRYRIEARNKAATIAIEMDTAQSLALGQGLPLDETLNRLKAKGVGAVVLEEETVGDLVGLGEIDLGPDRKLTGTPQALKRVLDGLNRRLPGPPLASLDPSQPGMPDLATLKSVSVGLSDEEAQEARAVGLRIIGRLGNPIGATDRYVRATLQAAHDQGADIFLPVGDQVLGRRDSTKVMEDALRSLHMLYASPEFAKLGGDEEVVRDVPDLVVRLHSAQANELDKLPYVEAVDRYARAARERNQRILLLRPVVFSSAAPLDSMCDFVSKVAVAVKKQGGAIGVAKPFQDSRVPSALFPLLGLALAPGIWLSVAYFVKGKRIQIVGAILLALLGLACVAHSARPVLAFLAAVAYPILAFQVLEARKGRSWLIEYVLVCAISLVGGLGVAGLLNGLPYFVRAEQFEGVKGAVFIPIAVVGAMLYAHLSNLKSSLKSSISWSQAALTLVLLGLLAFMISRTGNDNPAGVSTVELRLRSLLDAVLFVRPRTKEFLVGHPFLVLGIAMLIKLRSGWKAPRGFGGWTALALTIGAVGQTDIVNTMCHFHTPVALSLVRIVVGMAAGGILGAALWVLVSFLLNRTPSLSVDVGELEPMRSEVAH